MCVCVSQGYIVEKEREHARGKKRDSHKEGDETSPDSRAVQKQRVISSSKQKLSSMNERLQELDQFNSKFSEEESISRMEA